MWWKRELRACARWLALLLLGGSLAAAAVREGDRLPELTTFELEGELPDLAGKVVLLDFWASWCAPCKASFPALSALQAELKASGVVVLAVSVDKSASAYRKFLDRHVPGFATVRDAKQALAATMAVPTMPTTYLIGRDGVVRRVHEGFQGAATADELRREALVLVEEKS